MAFDAGYADKINNALEEYRQDESEMRQNAPGAENFKTKAEGQKTPEIKKEPVDGSVEITFDPDGMTANMILHKAYNGGRPGFPGLLFYVSNWYLARQYNALHILNM